MNLEDVKKYAPFGEQWYVEDFLGNDGTYDLFLVKNSRGDMAELRTVIIPGQKLIDDLEEEYGKSDATNEKIITEIEGLKDKFVSVAENIKNLSAENDSLLKIFDCGSFIVKGGYCLYVIEEKAISVEDYLRNKILKSEMIMNLASNVANALYVCENNNIIHGDVTCNNVFLVDGNCKLGNFGYPLVLEKAGLKMAEKSPQVPSGIEYDAATGRDMYLYGLMLYSLYNFKRLPFLPSKNDQYIISDFAKEQALNKRLKGEVFPAPLYADATITDIINKCCSIDKNLKYKTYSDLIKDIENVKNSGYPNSVIQYPDCSVFDGDVNSEKKGSNVMNEKYNTPYETEEVLTARNDQNRPVDNKPKEENNIYTMGAQAYYTEAMSQLRSNRSIRIDESILQNIDKTSKKIADKYGYESKEYRKFLEKLKEYENRTEEVKRLSKGNKRSSVMIKVLSGVAIVAVLVGGIFLLNSNTYYANQGQYNYIYKRNLIGKVDIFKEVPAKSIEKVGSKLYYIDIDDNHIYQVSVRAPEEETIISTDNVAHFEVIDDVVYYINMSENNKLYKVNTDGSGRECIYQNPCISLSADGDRLEFIDEQEPESPKLYNTKTDTVQKALIE